MKLYSTVVCKRSAEYTIDKEATCTNCKAQEAAAIERLTPTIELNATSIMLKVRQSTNKLKVSGLADGDKVESWKSSNTKIVKVTKSGKIIAQKRTGSANITVTLRSGKKAVIKVKVQKGEVKTRRISGISRSLSVKRNKRVTLKPVISPITSIQKVTYTSSNKQVATVTSRGVVKGLRKGTAVITVRSGSKAVKCRITVK